MTAVLAAIKESGIDDRDIQTSRLSLQPQYDPNKAGTARLTGFQVTNQLTVKIHDIGKLPDILDRAIAAGANEMSGIEFAVSEQSQLLDQARAEAIADAHRKAELYAQAAGAKLGRVLLIADESAPAPRPLVQAMRAGAVPVAPGEQMLRVAVTVSYELDQRGASRALKMRNDYEFRSRAVSSASRKDALVGHDELVIVGRLAGALVIGAMIGFERTFPRPPGRVSAPTRSFASPPPC